MAPDTKPPIPETEKTKDDKGKKITKCEKCLVLLGAFICQFFSAGFGNSLGIFYVEFLATFPVGRGIIGWATSICSGLVFGAGLIVGIIVQKFGPRKSAIAGGFLSFVGLLISSFATHIAVIYVAFGLITGSGACLVCVSSFVTIGQHFKKSRGSASSIAVVGSGLGGLLLPILLRPLIDEFGWRGALLMLSGLMLNVLPAAGLFIPAVKETTYSAQETAKKIKLKSAFFSRSMWSNSAFVCYLIICPLMSIGYQYTYVVIVDLGILLGFSKVRSTLLLTYMSLASTISTLCFGCIMKLLWNYSVFLFNSCVVFMSAVMFVFPYVTSYETLVVVSAAYGAAIGGINALYAVIPADILGLKRFSTGLGFVCTAFGVGYLLSAPVAGALNDATGTYNISFYVAGSLCIGCVIPFVIIRFIQVRQKSSSPEEKESMEIVIS